MAIFVLREEHAATVVNYAGECGLKAVVAGIVEAAPNREVRIDPLNVTLGHELLTLKK